MAEENKNKTSSYDNVHWADNSAQRVIDRFPNHKIYTVASGISPSGIIHIGHFREIITSELVRKSLENKGKKTKFIYSWDSYDAFRKVPSNIPKEWKKYLRLPISKVPDVNNKYESYAEKFMQEAEKSLEIFNFPIIFQRQHLLQTSGIYADGIKEQLNRLKDIKKILNKFRENPLAKDWIPLTVYSEKTGKDTTKVLEYDGNYNIKYKCLESGFENTINFKETPIVKLAWRLDWPMRWNHYGVNFEPGGKDHSTPGGSYDTGCEIIELVSNSKAPVYTFYNFVGMKGQAGKVSSSSGNGATIADVLKIYSPELILFLFAGTRPNAEFDISFDLDVIKNYEDFDKIERLYYGIEKEKNPKKLATQKRIYELSIVNGRKIEKDIPIQPSFRHLVNVIQANDFSYKKVEVFFRDEIKTEYDKIRLKERFNCVKNWIEVYAPEDMKFKIQDKIGFDLSKNEKEIILDFREFLKNTENVKELVSKIKEICSKNNLEMKVFFTFMYKLIIGKEKGPKLSSILLDNKKKILLLFEKI